MDADPANGILLKSRSSDRTKVSLSWKTWLALLFLSLAAIAGSIAAPIYRHWEAINYLEEENVPYGLTDDSEWMTERFGERARGFRSVEWIELARVPDDGWRHIAVLDETQTIIGNMMHQPFKVPPQGTVALCRMNSLKNFSVDNPGLPDEFFAEFFSSRPPLVDVSVASSKMSSRGLWELSHIVTIEDLSLYWNLGICDDDFRNLPPLPELRKASIDTIGDYGLRWLSQSPLIEELSIGSHSSMTNEGLASLGQLEALTYLRLNGGNIGAEGIAHLEQLPQLVSIHVPSECINWDAVESLRRMPSLRRVTVWGGISTELETAMRDEWELTVYDWSDWIIQASDEE